MPYYMYVASQGENKLVRFAMDAASGELEPLGEVPVPGGPAPIAIDPSRQFLYVARRGERKISSFRIDPHSGSLALLGSVDLLTDPCYLATDRRGKFLLASYYEGRGITIHPIGADGAVGDPPVERRETRRGAHSIQTDPSNRFAFVPHIAGRGPNQIWQFRFDEETGHLTPNSPAQVIPDQPLGPRHFCFHPSLDVVYFSNEQGCSVTAYRFDTSAGTLSPMQTVSTLPADYTGQNSCSKIQITASGKFLYAPNRGHNSIAGFTVEAGSGRLTAIGQTLSEPVPRAFSLDPAGHFLYAAGLESGRLAAYRIDTNSGALQPLKTYAVGARPMWVTIIELAG